MPATRICVVTSGHLSTCPRMLKAADALAGAGYEVKVVSTRFLEWAARADADVLARRERVFLANVVDYSRDSMRTYLWSGGRSRLAKSAARALGVERSPFALVSRAYGRVHSELVRAAVAARADFYYGGTSGALAAVADAGRQTGKPYALDLEDYHGGETSDPFEAHLARRVLSRVLPPARFLTAGSAAIAEAYREAYAVLPLTVNNVFPLPQELPPHTARVNGRLRLYWFSQTIGGGRGLEDVVDAVGVGKLDCELHLRGRPVPGYLDTLRRRAASRAPALVLAHHEPAPPDAMVDLARSFDVGLSLEPTSPKNQGLALGNKALTYVVAGLAVALTQTIGQEALARDLGDGAFSYVPGDVQALARGLKRWTESPGALARSKAAAWEAAKRRWHWEHAEERGKLLDAVKNVLPD